MNFFGSEKYFQNRTPTSVRKLETELDNRTPHEWFMAPNNKKHVAAQLLHYRIILDEILQPARYEDDGVDTMVVKKASEMTAADMRNLNVYDPTYDRDLYAKTIGLALKRNGKNRFQKNMHARHNDRGDTEGWRSKDEDMGSRGNLVRKFDMSEFRKYAVNAHRPLSHNQFQY
jgi:hypothetical protein